MAAWRVSRLTALALATLKWLGVERSTELKYHDHGKPIPRGWQLGENIDRLCHHHQYNVIIYRRVWEWRGW